MAGGVGGGAIHLGGVLAGEGAAAVAGGTAIGVHDDLAAGKSGIPLGTTDNKLAGGVHQKAGGLAGRLDAQVTGGRYHQVCPEVVGDPLAQGFRLADAVNLRGVLGGNQNCVDGHRQVVFIDDAHLGLAIGQQVFEAAVVAQFRQAAGQPVGQADR